MENNGHLWCGKRKPKIDVVQVLADQIGESSGLPEEPFLMSDSSTYPSLARTISKNLEAIPDILEMALLSHYLTVVVNTVELINSINHLVYSYKAAVRDATCSRLNSDLEAQIALGKTTKESGQLNTLTETRLRLAAELFNIVSLKGNLAMFGKEQDMLRSSCEAWKGSAKAAERALGEQIDFWADHVEELELWIGQRCCRDFFVA